MTMPAADDALVRTHAYDSDLRGCCLMLRIFVEAMHPRFHEWAGVYLLCVAKAERVTRQSVDSRDARSTSCKLSSPDVRPVSMTATLTRCARRAC